MQKCQKMFAGMSDNAFSPSSNGMDQILPDARLRGDVALLVSKTMSALQQPAMR
jgi:hypothetical protein